MKITKEHSLFNGVTNDDILKFLEEHPENLDCPVMLYAADDFDDFIATLKDIEIQRNLTDERYENMTFDVMWNKFYQHIGRDMKEDEAKSLFTKQCKDSLKVRDFIEKLRQVELGDFQITASTENGRIYFLITDIEYQQVQIPGIGVVLMLTGNF